MISFSLSGGVVRVVQRHGHQLLAQYQRDFLLPRTCYRHRYAGMSRGFFRVWSQRREKQWSQARPGLSPFPITGWYT